MSKKHPAKPSDFLHQGTDNSAPYPVSRMAPAFELVDLARQIGEADQVIAGNLNSRLRVIADQIKHLQQEAHAILDQAKNDQLLHRAQCNFQRKPGQIYHLYEKADGGLYFSMLSAKEWGASPPHRFVGSYRLENDMSWTRLEDVAEVDAAASELAKLIGHLPGESS